MSHGAYLLVVESRSLSIYPIQYRYDGLSIGIAESSVEARIVHGRKGRLVKLARLDTAMLGQSINDEMPPTQKASQMRST
jgi:hypothetical protein